MASPTPTPALPRLLKALVVSSVGVAASHLVLSDTLCLSFTAQASAALVVVAAALASLVRRSRA
ncbi:hypothetical protein GT043_38255 [Streptomyces sp. SID2131]|nr:hypothetical protein [Streptomyces sp. SID2131]